MKSTTLWLGTMGCLLSLMLVGCSGGGSGQTVTGTVTLDGQPLVDAEVEFVPFDRSQNLGTDITRTDSSGQFEIKPHSRKAGLKPGKFAVYISKWVNKKTKKAPPPEELEMEKAAGTLVNLVPPRYNNKELDPALSADIKPGKNEPLKFQLSSK